MVPPSYFLYKWNGTDSDHVSSAAIFQPHNVSSAAFCQLRCSVLTQRIADCQLGCKVSAHWQIVSSSVNSKLSLNAQLQFLGSIAQLSLTLLWLCRSVHQIWPLHHHQQLKGGLISLSFARCYMPYRCPALTIIGDLKLLESWHAVQCTGTLLLIQTTQSKRQQSNCPKTGTAQAPWIMGDLQLWCTIDELELHMQGLFVFRCVVMCDFSLSVLGRQSDCWWLLLLIASVCLLNSSSFIFHAACSFELHVLHIWYCKHILTRSQTHCLRVHVSMQTMFLLLIHQVENSKCMWCFDKLFWQQVLNIQQIPEFPMLLDPQATFKNLSNIFQRINFCNS